MESDLHSIPGRTSSDKIPYSIGKWLSLSDWETDEASPD